MARSDKNEVRGIRAVLEALRLEDFPMTHEDIDYAVGDVEIEDWEGGWLVVRDLVDGISQAEFSSAEEFIYALKAERDRVLQLRKQNRMPKSA